MGEWLIINAIEITGAVLGLLFLYFEIKQNPLLWPLGLLTSLFYIVIFFNARFYADMGLQFYYVLISIYGWYFWVKGGKDGDSVELPVSRVSLKQAFWLIIITIPLFFVIVYILKNYTDSPVPFGDAFTTALSITATWMLARKILEQWLVWILVNAVSLALYIYKGLYPTVVLFVFYTLLSVVGYIKWKQTLKQQTVNA
jgi:nicotinamide mononucleotide transporter